MPLKLSDDAQDRTLRHVEEDVLIPKIMRRRAAELCQVQAKSKEYLVAVTDSSRKSDRILSWRPT